MWELSKKTSQNFMIKACRAGANDCLKDWKNEFFENGACKTYYGEADRTLDIGRKFLSLERIINDA